MEHFYFESAGRGTIHWVFWEPKEKPTAVLQIVHGVAEYIERYSEMAQYLTERGIAVAGEDHMGHGGSIGENCVKGCFYGGWDAVAADCDRLRSILMQRYPDTPVFQLGHSMGSFLVRTLLFRYPDSGIRGALISGTGWHPKAMLAAGMALSACDCKWKGPEHVSTFINNLAFGGYSKAFSPARTPHDWLSTDPAVVDTYEADPLCGFDVTSALALEMMRGLTEIENSDNLSRMNKLLPVWFYSGECDPVGDMKKGVDRSVAAFRKAGMNDVTLTYYPGRHEVHNEPVREKLFADIERFITAHI